MSDTSDNSRKQERPWEDLNRDKKNYLQRKQQEREARRALDDFRRHLRQEGDYDE